MPELSVVIVTPDNEQRAVLQVLVMPAIGWGFFGAHAGSTIWASSLIAHLVYGACVGALVDSAAEPAGMPTPQPR